MSFFEKINFKVLGDERGQLISLESLKNIPFEIKRTYYLFDLDRKTPRGFHAHKQLEQVAVCVAGSCRFIVDNGYERQDIILNSPDQGIFIPRMVWREMHDFDGAVIMVLASEYYEESDYIRDYNEFVRGVKADEQR